MATRILLVEEDQSRRERLGSLLAAEDCRIAAAPGPEAALRNLDEGPLDILLIGSPALDTPHGEQLLRRLRSKQGTAVVLMGPAEGLAAEATRRGAWDVLPLPYAPAEALGMLIRARERQRLLRENRMFLRDHRRLADDRPIVASETPMIELLESLERAAEFKAAVLLSGETGSGLEILARAIHSQSARRNQPFVGLHCGALSAEELEIELLGRSCDPGNAPPGRSAGLLAEVEGGSLFLDEVTALPESLQTVLLQILREDRMQLAGDDSPLPVDVRVIAATSRELDDASAGGGFDRDLAKLLNAFALKVPPLRDRPRDIPLLVDHLLAQACLQHGKPFLEISSDAIDVLVAYDWPGNVRELELAIERAVLLAGGRRITGRDLSHGLIASVRTASRGAPEPNFCLRSARKSLEADLIRQVLSLTSGNRTHAAKLLKISHRALLYKIKEHAIRD